VDKFEQIFYFSKKSATKNPISRIPFYKKAYFKAKIARMKTHIQNVDNYK
jgi:hypothetical protein